MNDHAPYRTSPPKPDEVEPESRDANALNHLNSIIYSDGLHAVLKKLGFAFREILYECMEYHKTIEVAKEKNRADQHAELILAIKEHSDRVRELKFRG